MPVKPPRTVDWVPNHVYLPEGSEYDGLFSFDYAPHTRAWFEAWDNPDVRMITVCAATRLVKTSTAIALMVFTAANDPRYSAFGAPDEDTLKRVVKEQLYPMLDRCQETRKLTPAAYRRNHKTVSLKKMRIRGAFGGSDSSVAGYPACYLWITEADKWPRPKTATEPDAIRAFLQRTKGYPHDRKIYQESTPASLATSRVWADLTNVGTRQHDYWVPCPFCGEYQLLVWGNRDSVGGVKWEKSPHGANDIRLAVKTAYYECGMCRQAITSEYRPQMMRAAKWLPEGQRINKHGEIYGEAKVDSWHWAFGPLSSLHSLLLPSWGTLVGDWLACGKDPEKIRDFQTSTLGLPWDPKPVKIEIPDLIKRLGGQHSIGECPEWALFLTCGVDVQDSGNTFVWVVCAWGLGQRGAVIDYGVCYSQQEFLNVHRTAEYRHNDKGATLRPSLTLIDSGDETDMVYQMCRNLRQVLPAKGASHSFPEAYQLKKLEEDTRPTRNREKIRRGGVRLLMVNTHRSQKWIQKHIDGEAFGLAPFELPYQATLDHDFLRELMDDTLTGNAWVKERCNDYRDCVRMNWAAAMYITNNGADWERLPPRQKPAPTTNPAPQPSGSWATAGGGRSWS